MPDEAVPFRRKDLIDLTEVKAGLENLSIKIDEKFEEQNVRFDGIIAAFGKCQESCGGHRDKAASRLTRVEERIDSLESEKDQRIGASNRTVWIVGFLFTVINIGLSIGFKLLHV